MESFTAGFESDLITLGFSGTDLGCTKARQHVPHGLLLTLYPLHTTARSCLVPVDVTSMPCLYVFVDIAIDVDHLVATVELNFE